MTGQWDVSKAASRIACRQAETVFCSNAKKENAEPPGRLRIKRQLWQCRHGERRGLGRLRQNEIGPGCPCHATEPCMPYLAPSYTSARKACSACRSIASLTSMRHIKLHDATAIAEQTGYCKCGRCAGELIALGSCKPYCMIETLYRS